MHEEIYEDGIGKRLIRLKELYESQNPGIFEIDYKNIPKNIMLI